MCALSNRPKPTSLPHRSRLRNGRLKVSVSNRSQPVLRSTKMSIEHNICNTGWLWSDAMNNRIYSTLFIKTPNNSIVRAHWPIWVVSNFMEFAYCKFQVWRATFRLFPYSLVSDNRLLIDYSTFQLWCHKMCQTFARAKCGRHSNCWLEYHGQASGLSHR